MLQVFWRKRYTLQMEWSVKESNNPNISWADGKVTVYIFFFSIFCHVIRNLKDILMKHKYCTARQCWPICQNFGECSIFNPTFIEFGETSSYCQFSLSRFFLLFIGHHRSANLVCHRFSTSRVGIHNWFHRF